MELTAKRRVPAVMAALVAAGLVLTGCAGGNDRTDDDKNHKKDDKKNDKKKNNEGEGGFGGPTESEDTEFQNPEDSGVFDIKVGDCIAEANATGEVQSLPTVPCSQPHTFEVFYEENMTDSKYPGQEQAYAEAEKICTGKAFEDFIGVPISKSQLGIQYLTPTQGSWDQKHDRAIQCMVYEGDGTGNQTSGSLEGSKK